MSNGAELNKEKRRNGLYRVNDNFLNEDDSDAK